MHDATGRWHVTDRYPHRIGVCVVSFNWGDILLHLGLSQEEKPEIFCLLPPFQMILNHFIML